MAQDDLIVSSSLYVCFGSRFLPLALILIWGMTLPQIMCILNPLEPSGNLALKTLVHGIIEKEKDMVRL